MKTREVCEALGLSHELALVVLRRLGHLGAVKIFAGSWDDFLVRAMPRAVDIVRELDRRAPEGRKTGAMTPGPSKGGLLVPPSGRVPPVTERKQGPVGAEGDCDLARTGKPSGRCTVATQLRANLILCPGGLNC